MVKKKESDWRALFSDVGALIVRIGLGGIVYYNHRKEPPKPHANY